MPAARRAVMVQGICRLGAAADRPPSGNAAILEHRHHDGVQRASNNDGVHARLEACHRGTQLTKVGTARPRAPCKLRICHGCPTRCLTTAGAASRRLMRMHAAPPPTKRVPRTAIRLAVPSKGRMAEDTLQLLKVRRAWLGPTRMLPTDEHLQVMC